MSAARGVRHAVTLATTLLAFAGTACHRSGSTVVTPAPLTAEPAPEPTPTLEPELEVLAAYRAYWAAVAAASYDADPTEVTLAETATATALAEMTRHLRQLRDAGRTIRGAMSVQPTAWLSSASTATVRDCQDSSRFLISDRDGRPLGRGVPRRDLAVAQLTRIDGRWLVADINVTPDGC